MAMSSSKEVDKTDRTEFESHERLDKAWNYTKNALELLSSCFRSIKGLEDVNVALCLRNSSRCDVYSVFNGVGLGKKSKADGISKVMRRSTNRGLHVSMLYGLSTKKFRVFFTNVRRGLGLTFFNWPKPARLLFQDICDDPLPSGPGRAHSGRDKLVLMLRLCCETDEAWYITAFSEKCHLCLRRKRELVLFYNPKILMM